MRVLDFDNLYKMDLLGEVSITVDVKIKATPEEVNKLYRSWKIESELDIKEMIEEEEK